MSSERTEAPAVQLLLSILGIFGVMVTLALCSLVIASRIADGAELTEVATRPEFLATSALLQTTLLLGLAVFLGRAFGITGLARPNLTALLVALAGGSVVGLLAGQLGGLLAQFFEQSSLSILGEQLQSAPWPSLSLIHI